MTLTVPFFDGLSLGKRTCGILEVVNRPDEEVYEKHAEELTRFATGLVGPTDASDVVSSAVLSCMSSKQWSKVVHLWVTNASADSVTELTAK